MSYKECPIPNFIDELQVGSGPSLKLNLTPPELVVGLNDKDKLDLLNALKQEGDLARGATLTMAIKQHFCEHCGLCWPMISTWRELRIEMTGYHPIRENENAPFFALRDYIPDPCRFDNLRLVVIDDRDSVASLAELLAEKYPSRAIKVSSNARPTEKNIRELIEVTLSFNPLIVICDKGLGFADGIDVIKRLNGCGLITVMYTGEWQTDETRRVATHFIQKPNIDEIEELLEVYWQNMQTA